MAKPKAHTISMARDRRGEWRAKVTARNGKGLPGSEEGLKHRGYALRRVLSLYPEVQKVFIEGVQMTDAELEDAKAKALN